MKKLPVSLLFCVLTFVCVTALIQPHADHTLPGWQGESNAVGFGTGTEAWRGEIIQLSWAPRAYLLKGLLSPDECDHLIKLAKPTMSKSSVADNKTGKSFASEIRTSTGTFLAKKHDAIVDRLEQRIAQVTMVPIDNQEGMQILHYQDGQKYEPHHDYFHDTVNSAPEKGGQRLVTVLMYLTTVEEGGETVFPNADRKVTGPEWSDCAKKGMAVKATRGDAVMFFALHPDGKEDPTSLHGSCPTTKGEKWSATKWIHIGSTSITNKQQQDKWHGIDITACADQESECSGWAQSGECESNPAYMRLHCRKACNLCVQTSPPA